MPEAQLYNCISCGCDTEYSGGFCGKCSRSRGLRFAGSSSRATPYKLDTDDYGEESKMDTSYEERARPKIPLAVRVSFLPAPVGLQEVDNRTSSEWKIPVIGKAKKKMAKRWCRSE